MTANDLLKILNKGFEYYTIVMTDTSFTDTGDRLTSEDGTPVGYDLVNNITGVVELTSTALPTILWQGTHCDSTIKSFLKDDSNQPELATVEDIMPTLQ